MKLSGRKLNVNKKGELEVGTELGTVKFTKPIAYQEEGGKREFVEVAYVVKGDEYSFRVGEYDGGKELVETPAMTVCSAVVATIHWMEQLIMILVMEILMLMAIGLQTARLSSMFLKLEAGDQAFRVWLGLEF
jgi:hypothetical protein